MRWFSLTFICLFGALTTGCEILNSTDPTGLGSAWVPPEKLGRGYADIQTHWRLEGKVLSVRRDISKKQVLYAGAQEGAKVTSLALPIATQVSTVGHADEIYFDAFLNRFDLIGDPFIEQGTLVTRRYGPDARLYLHGDGTIKDRVPDAGTVGPASQTTTTFQK